MPTCLQRLHVAEMFRADMGTAGFAYRDDNELVADFQSMHHTFISNLARGDVHPKTALTLARHSTIALTMDRYSHTLVEEQSQALEVLPDLLAIGRQAARAIGTDGATVAPCVLASCLALSGRLPATSVGADRRTAGVSDNVVLVKYPWKTAEKPRIPRGK